MLLRFYPAPYAASLTLRRAAAGSPGANVRISFSCHGGPPSPGAMETPDSVTSVPASALPYAIHPTSRSRSILALRLADHVGDPFHTPSEVNCLLLRLPHVGFAPHVLAVVVGLQPGRVDAVCRQLLVAIL